MDTISFAAVEVEDETGVKPAAAAIGIQVNGRDLLERVREVEAPFAAQENHPDLAGAYRGVRADYIPDVWQYFQGSGADWQCRTTLYECAECGMTGCWPLLARVEVGERAVTWAEFEQPHRGNTGRGLHWRHEGLGPFVFERGQYEAALEVLMRELSASAAPAKAAPPAV